MNKSRLVLVRIRVKMRYQFWANRLLVVEIKIEVKVCG